MGNMRDLEYPFDGKYIVNHKKKLKRLLLDEKAYRIKKRIAVLGGVTTNDIKDCMELFLLNYGIEPEFYESEYDRFYEDAMFPPEELRDFEPDIIYVCTSNRNIIEYPKVSDPAGRVSELLASQEKKMEDIWKNLSDTFHCPIIQNNYEKPFFRLLGNLDAYDVHGAVRFINQLNEHMVRYAEGHEGFYICDLDYISSDYGLSRWQDLKAWYLYKYPMALEAIPFLSFNVANIIKSIYGRNKKGLVLDLDNTLWGGVIGDDGVEGIEIGPEETVGQSYLEFQRYLALYPSIGIILNVVSKNDEENAIAGLNHPDGVLRPDDFVDIVANWEPKSINLKKIADDLNLLPDAFVFVDDNPAERQIVRDQLPGVSVPDVSEVSDFIRAIDRSGFFEVTVISGDDAKRDRMYRENAARAKQEEKFSDYKDFLLSLDMKGEIGPFKPLYIPRIAQLTNKSNQFNLTTKRMTEDDVQKAAEDSESITLCGRLEDRFGDNGVVSVVIGHMDDNNLHIELWLMSCRVLKRDMEFAMLDELVRKAADAGIETIYGYYYPTKKNGMVRDLYKNFGFEKVSEEPDGSTVWKIAVSGYKKQNHVISVNTESLIEGGR